jgi:hypothetical protein
MVATSGNSSRHPCEEHEAEEPLMTMHRLDGFSTASLLTVWHKILKHIQFPDAFMIYNLAEP